MVLELPHIFKYYITKTQYREEVKYNIKTNCKIEFCKKKWWIKNLALRKSKVTTKAKLSSVLIYCLVI